LVEHQLPKLRVAGSIPVVRSTAAETGKCRTLKTIHFLELHVTTNAPCDAPPGKLFHGTFIVRNLITAFENGDGARRGIHEGACPG
jgi:hypothetical protein